jgi:hypothetical protein
VHTRQAAGITVARLEREFGLCGASAVVLAGSRLESLDYPGSDIDVLAVFDRPEQVPATVPHVGVVSMANSMGENWIGRLDGEEVNITVVGAPAVRRLVRLLAVPLSAHRIPALQPLEVVTLHRIRAGVPLRGGPYLAQLVDEQVWARLPVAACVLYHCSAAGHIRLAGRLLATGDTFGFDAMMVAAAVALGIATVCAYGEVGTSIKRIATRLSTVEDRDGRGTLRTGDFRAIVSGTDAGARLAAAGAALERLRRYVEARASGGGPWAEGLVALDAAV